MNSSAPRRLVTEKTWPQQTLAQLSARPGQRGSGSPGRGNGRRCPQPAGQQLGLLGPVSCARLPSSPCLTAATSSSHSHPFISFLGHVNNVSLCSQVHTRLKKGGKRMCDILRFSHRPGRGGCATWVSR